MIKYIFSVTVIFLCFTFVKPAGAEMDYSLWNTVLKQYVNDSGLVDYAMLKRHPENLNAVIQQIEQEDISSYTDAEKKAFWINAYNAITLKVVTDAYPVKSIRRINFGFVWNIRRKAAQQSISLGDIEHKILRPLGDPRIHFAINCASIGCPNLLNKPFYPETLDEQLRQESVKFINNSSKVHLDRETNTLYISAIFEWFKEDFLATEESTLIDYIKLYLNDRDAEYLEKNDVRIQFLEYDWGLNQS